MWHICSFGFLVSYMPLARPSAELRRSSDIEGLQLTFDRPEAHTLPIFGRDRFCLRETVAEGSQREVFTTALLS